MYIKKINIDEWDQGCFLKYWYLSVFSKRYIHTEHVLFLCAFFKQKRPRVYLSTPGRRKQPKKLDPESKKGDLLGHFFSLTPQEIWSLRAASEEYDSDDTFFKVLIITQFAT